MKQLNCTKQNNQITIIDSSIINRKNRIIYLLIVLNLQSSKSVFYVSDDCSSQDGIVFTNYQEAEEFLLSLSKN